MATVGKLGTVYKRTDINSPFYYACFRGRDGKRKIKCTGVQDKRAAMDLLREWESTERRYAEGLRDEKAERETANASTALTKAVDRYESSLSAKGRGQDHINSTKNLILEVADFCKWSTMKDITSEGLDEHSAALRKQGLGARAIGKRITALKAFCNWAASNEVKLIPYNPVASTIKPNIDVDRRLERRPLTPDEWTWLQKTLHDRPEFRNGQSAEERRIMYRVALETGFRNKELRSLTKASIKLAGEPYIFAAEKITKNAQKAKQYISERLAEQLRTYLKTCSPTGPIFTPKSRQEMARVLRADVADARQYWEQAEKRTDEQLESDFLLSVDHDGKQLDIHALRHSCGYILMNEGFPITEVQKIMRHSTVVLTTKTYGHIATDSHSRSRHLMGSKLG